MIDTFDIHIKQPVPFAFGKILQKTGAANAGITDQNVQRRQGSNGVLHLGCVGNIAADGGRTGLGGNGCIGALSNVVPEICAAWVKAFRDNDMAGVAKGQQTIDRLMDLYAVRSPFLPVIKEACKLRGIASTSIGTFPMPNATIADDARILEILSREGIR